MRGRADLNAVPPDEPASIAKARLRAQFRTARTAHLAALPAGMRALMFHRPPGVLAERVPDGAVVGLYHAAADEAPTLGYARWFAENSRRVALPWFAGRDAAMQFRLWGDPHGGGGLERGPWGVQQPGAAGALVVPDIVFVPGLAFGIDGARLGQGGGHYDRWLAAHPGVPAIGMAWDCQIAEALPLEPHDRPLAAVVTPGRVIEVLAVDGTSKGSAG